MAPKFVLLWTDIVIWLLIALLVGYGWLVTRNPVQTATWKRVFRDPAALASSMVIGLSVPVAVRKYAVPLAVFGHRTSIQPSASPRTTSTLPLGHWAMTGLMVLGA